ncbi:MAG: EAL domain-containing protein [Dechloromonas sp.]|nr:EAL domain-containing protein [Dechloromonas sp.]
MSEQESTSGAPEPGPATSPLYWVGLGASAGGLDALMHCVAHLPRHARCVFIVAQHISPGHRSLMAEILGRETNMPVCEAISGTRPKSDHIYVVPPGQNLVLRDGRLSLTPTSPEISPKPSINLLFQSLADNVGEHAIGIVLSGTGSDGTSGLRAIKVAGGIGIAQNPNSAKYNAMPLSAINAGVVDRILDPEQIGPELAQLIECAGELTPEAQEAAHSPEIDQLFAQVEERTRIDFSGYKMSTVLRRLQRRLAATHCRNTAEYLRLCEENPEELDTLARETLISVTEFFRDRDAFRALAIRINEIVTAKGATEECRVWVIGCATGEEVYSIAILFAEALGQRLSKRTLQIFATDIDEVALSVARRAIYSSAALNELPADLLSKFFQPVDGGMQVTRSLRECITFARQNLIADPPFLRLDLVTCRNVLIYFTPELQSRALATIRYGLRDDGLLFLGRSEHANHPDELFVPADRRNRLYKRRSVERSVDIAQVVRGTLARNVARRAPKQPSAVEQRFADAVGQVYARQAVLIDQAFNILYSRGNLTPFIDLPQGSPQMNLAQIITQEFRGELATTVNRARRNNQPARSRRRRILRDQGDCWQLTAYPVRTEDPGPGNFLIVFEASPLSSDGTPQEPADDDELAATREHLHVLIEEMAATNEEMQALNEEVQATNEELEAANEELQASNEELVAVNDESVVKSAELAAVNADFESVYNTLDFPVIVFDVDLFIKRVNVSATRRFDLPDGIAGQHLGLLRLPDLLRDLPQRMQRVLNEQRKESYSVSEGENSWQVFITPALNSAGTPQSLVLVVIDHSQLARIEARLRQSQEELLAIMNHSPSLVCLKDTAGRYHFANPRWCKVFGLDGEAIMGRTDAQLLPGEIARQLRERDLTVMSELGSNEALLEFTLDTDKRFFQTVSFPIFAIDGSVQFICTQAVDVTHKQHAEEQLRLAAKVFDRAGEAISVTDAEGKIITVNAAFTQITGFTLEEVVGKKPTILQSGHHDKAFYEAMWHSLAENGFWQGEILNKRKNGEIFPEWLTINSVTGSDGRVHNYVAIFSDISAIKTSHRRIEFMATHDELTTLPNRNLLIDRLKHSIAQAQRQKSSLAILFIDLDNFKHINDSLGHDAGDELLKEAARRLQSCVRDADTLARLGGDEFVALLIDVDFERIRQVATRIIDFLSASFLIFQRNLFVSASIGISIYPNDGTDSTSLLKNADTAMYRAKERGKNQFQFFADEMKVIALQRMTLESGLRVALDAGHFSVVFQPKVELHSRRVVSAEALLRWHDVSLDAVSPSQFIPVAEHCGLINLIGDRALELVLGHMRDWQDSGLALLPISINVSSHQLRNREFSARLEELVKKSGIPANRLCIEITESALMQDIETSRQILDHLTQLGLSISIDDFGTGYSSLAYLKQLPLAEVKVDKSFIANLDSDANDLAITKAVIDLAHALGLMVVAEGVERASHVEPLVALGCDIVQGYYFHRPLDADAFGALLTEDLAARTICFE